jgi:hypothetical protein
LSVASQNRQEDGVDAGHASRSSGLFHMGASRVSVFQFASKLAEARRWVVNVTPSRMLRQVEAEDRQVDATGCIGPCYPYFAIFYVLGHRGILVF